MLDKKQVALLVPYLLLLLASYGTGIAGWGYNIADDHWQTFLYTMGGVFVGAVILFVLWMFSPTAKANNV